MKRPRGETYSGTASGEFIKRSYDFALESSKRLRKTYNEEHEILTKLHDLRTSLEIVQKQKLKTENSCKHAANEYARLSCVQLCQLMYKTLPLELREQIYTYLLGPGGTERISGPDSVKFRMSSKHTAKMPTRRFTQAPHPKYGRQPSEPSYFDLSLQDQHFGVGGYEHWLYHAYTGEHVDREIVSHWYRAQTFVFEDAHHRQWLNEFLKTDIFGKRLVPGDIVQHIQFNVWESDVLSAISKLKLMMDLDALQDIGNKNVKLVLRIPAKSPVMRRGFTDIVKALKPTVKKLRGLGFTRVEVREKGRLDRKNREMLGRDVTRLFD